MTPGRRLCDESQTKSFLLNVLMVLSVFILLAACATIPADGEAIQCAACEEIALVYFAGGRLPERCLECGGKLSVQGVAVQGVDVTKSGGALLSEAGSL